MRPLEAPKLKIAPKGSEEPNRHRKVPGMVKRLRRGSIWNTVSALGQASDVAVLKASRKEELVRNLAFAIHQQRLWGSLDRLRKQFWMGMLLPSKIVGSQQQSAFKAQEERK